MSTDGGPSGGRGRLSDGVLVEARIRARLFGAPILRIDAHIVLNPLTSPAVSRVPTRVDRASPPRALPRSNRLPSAPSGSPLAEAISLVRQSADSLNGVAKRGR